MSSLLETIKNKRQAIAAKSGRERPAKLASAKNLIRILPRWDGNLEGEFYHDFGQHFIKDKAGNVLAIYVCTATTFGRECEVCSEIARHSASTTDEEVVHALGEARSSNRVLVNAIYMNGPHANAKTDPVLLELPVTVMNDILGIMETYMEDHQLNLISLSEGYDVVITKTGAGRETKYTVTPSPKPRAISPDVLQKARNLDDYAKQEYDAGLQKAIASLNGVAGNVIAASRPALNAPNAHAHSHASTTQSSTTAALADTQPFDVDDLATLEAELENEVEREAPVSRAKPAVAAKPVPAATDIDADLADLDAMLAEAAA